MNLNLNNNMPLEKKSIMQKIGIDPVVDDRHIKPHQHISFSQKMLESCADTLPSSPTDGFRDALAVVVVCDFNGQHSAHTCDIPVPLHDADVEYFKRMEPLVKEFYSKMAKAVKAVRVVSTVLEVTLNDGTRSYHAIQPR